MIDLNDFVISQEEADAAMGRGLARGVSEDLTSRRPSVVMYEAIGRLLGMLRKCGLEKEDEALLCQRILREVEHTLEPQEPPSLIIVVGPGGGGGVGLGPSRNRYGLS